MVRSRKTPWVMPRIWRAFLLTAALPLQTALDPQMNGIPLKRRLYMFILGIHSLEALLRIRPACQYQWTYAVQVTIVKDSVMMGIIVKLMMIVTIMALVWALALIVIMMKPV